MGRHTTVSEYMELYQGFIDAVKSNQVPWMEETARSRLLSTYNSIWPPIMSDAVVGRSWKSYLEALYPTHEYGEAIETDPEKKILQIARYRYVRMQEYCSDILKGKKEDVLCRTTCGKILR